MSTVYDWGRLTREEIDALAPTALTVIPVGTTEQHGPHLATGTDALIAESVALRAAEAATSPDVILLAPTLVYGASHHHLPFGGTLSLDVDTFGLVLRDLLASAAATGCTRVFVVNAHGGNAATCVTAVTEASRELGIVAATVLDRRPSRTGRGGGAGPRPRRQLRDVASARARCRLRAPRSAGAVTGRRRASPPRGESSSQSRDAGSSWTGSPTAPTRHRPSGARRRSMRACTRLRAAFEEVAGLDV